MIRKSWSGAALAVIALAMPLVSRADITNQTATLSAGQSFSLDQNAVVSSGGDIQFTGSSITFLGSAKGGNLSILDVTGMSGYNTVDKTLLQELGSANLASSSPIPTNSLTAGSASGSVIGVLTNGGNYAKLLVTALSSTSISFEFTTYGSTGGSGGTGGGSAPTITDIQNNSSLIPAGFPNSGIAPSTLFVLHGSGLASATTVTALQDSSQAGGLPTTLNGATVTITDSTNKTFHPGLYYAIAAQIAGVLPAGVHAGSATVTVNYNGTSSALTFNVVSSAYGIDTYDGNLGVVQDALNYGLVSYTSSAKPGQIVILWGSGLGADSADSDVSYTGTPHTISTPVQVYVGGVLASNIGYSGASVYPGVHIIQFTMPSGVPNGCYVPVAVVTGGSTVSNIASIPFMDGGGVCNDAYTGINGSTISGLGGSSTVRYGSVFVEQITSPSISGPPTTSDFAGASFEKVTSSGFTGSASSSSVSAGGCTLIQSVSGSISGTSTSTPLDAGTITLTPPGGSAITLQTIPQEAGFYEAQLASGAIPATGGSFVFNGSGGSGSNAVGPFTATVNFSSLLNWTNQSASASVARSSGQTYSWNGGTAGTYVIMIGTSISGTASASYTCIAPQSAGQFTVPSYILLGLPSGTGSSSIENSTAYNSFTASGIDYGISLGLVSTSVTTNWQ